MMMEKFWKQELLVRTPPQLIHGTNHHLIFLLQIMQLKTMQKHMSLLFNGEASMELINLFL